MSTVMPFSRLIVLERHEDMTVFFKFELIPFPTSMFKTFQMRKRHKAVRKHHLITDVPVSQRKTDNNASFR